MLIEGSAAFRHGRPLIGGIGMTGWAAQQIPAGAAPGTVILFEGTAFCVCGQSGDIARGGTDGVFFRDTRLLSRWELRLDEQPLEPLALIPAEPFSATFLGRGQPRPGRAESSLLVTRVRYVGDGMREDVTVRNLSREQAGLILTMHVESDLCDLFDVKSGRLRVRGDCSVDIGDGVLTIMADPQDRRRGVRISAEGASVSTGRLSYFVAVPARGTWRTTVMVQPIIDGETLAPRFPAHRPVDRAEPARRLQEWQQDTPGVRTRHAGLARVLERSRADLGSLRIFDETHVDRPSSIAAGAPWFMTLFGRDSLITSHMTLLLDRSLALGTLLTLADLQGERVDPLTEEEPGKIMHELRGGVESGVMRDCPRGAAYYGSVDATPLFVGLLGELRRWGLHHDQVEKLIPHADRAIEWIEQYGDMDGDGFVEYQRKTDRGLVNQGWKDSFDAINFADGSPAAPPIALAEVQAYVHRAYHSRALLAREHGDEAVAEHCAHRAARLKERFNRAFWLPDRGWYAVGLDRDKRPIDALASNMGQCLLSGIVDADKAAMVAERLMSPEMFSGWGIRTLATTMGAYNPMSYHNGSVWPHDNAMIATGLMRYGFVREAQSVAMSLLDAAHAFDGRLPELFCGFDRTEYPQPIPYPTSCSPQAWAAASPVQLVRTLLRFDPWIPYRRAWLAPVLPPGFDLRIDRLWLAERRVSINVTRGRVKVSGWPDDIELIAAGCPPLPATEPYGGAP
jgi:glycogen debranching enzyme